MILQPVILLTLHFIADFMLQTRSMGLNKGKSIMWLSIHVGVYLITFLVFGLVFGHLLLGDAIGMDIILKYCILNASLHWLTDFTTSKLSGYCYLKSLKYKEQGNTKKEHFWQYHFWSVIGFDQLVHASTLLVTFHYFFVV